MGVIATAKVVTGTDRAGRPRTVQPGNQEWVTIIECINALGGAIPLLVIFEAVMQVQGQRYTTQLVFARMAGQQMRLA
jgi:hypothetical protein